MLKQTELDVYTSPQCRIVTVGTSSVLCASVNEAPGILYQDDIFTLLP